MRKERLKCPACECMTRRDGDAMCFECSRHVPMKDRRAHQAIWRLWKRGERTLAQLVDSINATAKIARDQRYRGMQ